jgi:putative oxidoreductase
MKKLLDWLLDPPVSAPKATVLIRWMAGGVFLWEGILKFVYTNQGVGRFTKIGIPFPHFSAPAIAVFEIVGGLLLMAGLGTRFVSIPFVAEMLVAMATTKIALFLGTSPLPLPPAPPQVGIWAVLHDIRSDYAQLMSVLFLAIAGPGRWSVDAVLARRRWDAQAARVLAHSAARQSREDALRLAR